MFNAKDSLIEGVNLISDAVMSTFGPHGQNVLIKSPSGLHITKDGATVAKFIQSEDPFKNLGVDIIREIAMKTAKDVGDGPQPLYSKILTPEGFVSMGNIKIGQKICGTNQTVQEVVGVFPKGEKQIYKMVFEHNRIVECCEDHLWTVTTNYGKVKTLTTKELIESGRVVMQQKNGNIKYGYYVQTTIPEFSKKLQILDPYLLGLLLGDGSLTGTGSIELCIGFNKEHVINKIVVPEGISLTITKNEERHSFRIKLKGKNSEGETAKDIIEKLGLLGVDSENKFIPKNYLYSTYEDRLKLLQGLLDTDGHINKRGLFEFSTVSKQLAKDFMELVSGVGRSTTISIHDRSNDTGSYSEKSVYRMYERKGYKHGIKLLSIEATDKYTEMQCIKVSNPDNLYITDNYIVTHNTTSATVLAKSIVNGLKNNPDHSITINRILQEDVKKVLDLLEKQKISIESKEDLIKVATMSVNGDTELGELIGATYHTVGKDGVVLVEESSETDTSVDITNGVKFEGGYHSPYFINNLKNECVLENVSVVCYEKKITTMKDIEKDCIEAINNNKALLIIAPHVESSVMMTLLRNRDAGKLQSCCVKTPGQGIFRTMLLEDIKAIKNVSKIIAGREEVVIVGEIEEKVKEIEIGKIRKILSNKDLSEFEIKFHKRRLANYLGGIATIFIGGYSSIEIKEKKDRVDDAIAAVKAAYDGGVLPGGGISLFKASNTLDLLYLKTILQEPIKVLSKNANTDIEDIPSDFWMGKNFRTGVVGNMYEMGIIDPYLVTKISLENAVNAASLVLTSGCSIISM